MPEKHFVRSVKEMMDGNDINFAGLSMVRLPHDSSCVLSCMNKKDVNSKSGGLMRVKKN